MIPTDTRHRDTSPETVNSLNAEPVIAVALKVTSRATALMRPVERMGGASSNMLLAFDD